MEVLKKGRKPEEETATWDCKHCHSQIRARRDEGRFEPDVRAGDAVVFKCPVCSTENWVSVRLFNDGRVSVATGR